MALFNIKTPTGSPRLYVSRLVYIEVHTRVSVSSIARAFRGPDLVAGFSMRLQVAAVVLLSALWRDRLRISAMDYSATLTTKSINSEARVHQCLGIYAGSLSVYIRV